MLNTQIYDYFVDNVNVENCDKDFSIFKRKLGKSRVRSTQDSYELRMFLRWLRAKQGQIKSYLEVGPSSGGTFYILTSYLKSLSIVFNKSHALDIREKMRRYAEYEEHMRGLGVDCKFIKSNSQIYDLQNNFYDLIFIDANHSARGVTNDFMNYSNHCRFIAFHDIAYTGNKHPCGVAPVWNLLRQQHDVWYEFINPNSTEYILPLGIGIIDVDSANSTDYSWTKKIGEFGPKR